MLLTRENTSGIKEISSFGSLIRIVSFKKENLIMHAVPYNLIQISKDTAKISIYVYYINKIFISQYTHRSTLKITSTLTFPILKRHLKDFLRALAFKNVSI